MYSKVTLSSTLKRLVLVPSTSLKRKFRPSMCGLIELQIFLSVPFNEEKYFFFGFSDKIKCQSITFSKKLFSSLPRCDKKTCKITQKEKDYITLLLGNLIEDKFIQL